MFFEEIFLQGAEVSKKPGSMSPRAYWSWWQELNTFRHCITQNSVFCIEIYCRFPRVNADTSSIFLHKKSHQMTIFAVSGGIFLWKSAVPKETDLPSCRTFWAFHNAYKSKNPTIHAAILTVYRRIFLELVTGVEPATH